jgi:heptosyltransferase II
VTSTVIIQAKRGIGDVIWHLPFIRAIAAATPERRVTFLTPPSSLGAELLQAETCVARTLYFEHGGSELARGVQIYRLVRMLRALQPQTVWILDKTIRPALAAWLAGVPRRIGMGLGRQRLLITNKGLAPAYAEEYPIECLTALLRDLQVPLETTEPNLRLTPEVLAAVGERFGKHARPWLTIALGASLPEKDWSTSQWETFLNAIRHRAQGTIFLVGGLSNSPRAAELIRATSGTETINACDLSLVDSAALMKHADLFAGPNSGPMNVAAAVGTTAFGFFATNRVLTYSKHIRAILPDNGRIGPDGMQRLSPIRAADEVLVEFNRTSAPSLAPQGSSSAQT